MERQVAAFHPSVCLYVPGIWFDVAHLLAAMGQSLCYAPLDWGGDHSSLTASAPVPINMQRMMAGHNVILVMRNRNVQVIAVGLGSALETRTSLSCGTTSANCSCKSS